MSAGAFDLALDPTFSAGPPTDPMPVPPAEQPAPASTPPGAPPLTRAIRSLAFLATEGASLGFAGWCLRARDNLLNYVANNTLSPHARKFVIGNMLAGAAIAGLVGLVAILWRRLGGIDRRRARGAPAGAALPGGPVPLFFRWQLWYGGRELTFLAMVAAFVLGLQALMRDFAGDAAHLARTAAGPRRGPRLRRGRRPRSAGQVAAVRHRVGRRPRLRHLLLDHHHPEPLPPADDGLRPGDREQPGLERLPLQPAAVQDLGHRRPDHDPPRLSRDLYLVPDRHPLPPGTPARDAAGASGGADRRRGAAALRLRAPPRRRLDGLPAGVLLVTLYAPLQGSNLYDFHYLPFAPILPLVVPLGARVAAERDGHRGGDADAGHARGLVGAADGGGHLPGPDRRATAGGAGRHHHLGDLLRGHQAHPDAPLPERLPRVHQPIRGAAPRGGDRVRRRHQDGDRQPRLHRQQPARARQG